MKESDRNRNRQRTSGNRGHLLRARYGGDTKRPGRDVITWPGRSTKRREVRLPLSSTGCAPPYGHRGSRLVKRAFVCHSNSARPISAVSRRSWMYSNSLRNLATSGSGGRGHDGYQGPERQEVAQRCRSGGADAGAGREARPRAGVRGRILERVYELLADDELHGNEASTGTLDGLRPRSARRCAQVGDGPTG
jgi:hypothetical protein